MSERKKEERKERELVWPGVFANRSWRALRTRILEHRRSREENEVGPPVRNLVAVVREKGLRKSGF